MSVPKVSSDFISNVLNSYYANKGKSKDVKSERSAALGKNESGSSKSETSSSKYETSSSKYEERYYKAGSTKDDEDGSSRSEKTNSSKYYKSDSGMYDAYSLSKDYRASSNKDDESDSRRYDAYSSRQDDRPGSSKDYTKSKPSGKYEDYKDGSCTMEEDAYYDEMYPSHYDTYSDYPEYTHGNYPPMYLPEAEPPTPRPPPHGLPPGRPFPPMGFPRPPMPRGPHHPYPRGPPGTHYPYPRGPPFIERDGPRHQPPAHPYDRFDYPDDEYRGPPDNRYNDQRDDRPPKRRHDDDDKHYNRYPKKFTSEKSAKEIYDFDKLPKVLTDMFTSATCNLCLVTLHQPGLMELHYRGKNHIKRMKGWLYKFTGEHHTLTASEIEQIDAFEMKPNDIPGVGDTLSDDILDVEGTDVTYCKLCNIPISSAVVAKQHYSGKKHLKALKDSQLVEGEHSSKKPVDKLPDASKPKANSMCVNSRWFCHVCKVNSVSEEQYESHLIGKRHKKAWKATQVVAPVGLQNVAQSRHKPINYDIDPELLEDHGK
uniref:Zinc finger protein 346 n=1 Tax=Cacopsylla melanoneura TaxID=428564 RepID=A0A8D8LMP8_9HEMI